jgi:ATP-dependent DNA ligase
VSSSTTRTIRIVPPVRHLLQLLLIFRDRNDSPGAASQRIAEQMEKSRWLKPRLVVTIEYLEWTAANHLRLARFVGLPPRKR